MHDVILRSTHDGASRRQAADVSSLARRPGTSGLAEHALGEEPFQRLPAFFRDEIGLRRGVAFAVSRVKADHPAQAGVVLVMRLLKETRIADTLANLEDM